MTRQNTFTTPNCQNRSNAFCFLGQRTKIYRFFASEMKSLLSHHCAVVPIYIGIIEWMAIITLIFLYSISILI